MRLVQPWPDPYTINARSPYGPRQRHPITGQQTFHHGVDVAAPIGTRLTAPAPGTIVHKGNNGSGGITLIIRHANNLHTVYYHLRAPSPHPIGATVNTGEFIAEVGNTGASTGPHLHFEVRPNGRTWGQTDDPEKYLTTATPVAPVAPTPPPAPTPPQPPRPPKFNRPLTADHMARLNKRFGNFGRRGWFGG